MLAAGVSDRIPAQLSRGRESRYGTFGRLFVLDWSCFTLELPDRGNRQNRSRIPPGTYDMDLVTTGRPFSGRLQSYWIHPVDARTGILAHSGTHAGDVEQGLQSDSWGCVLQGYEAAWVAGQPGLLRSRPAVWDLIDNVLQGRPARLRVE